jgi:hypothetical protein
MSNIVKDPNPEKATPQYPTEFLDALKSDAAKFKSEGYTQNQVQEYINAQFSLYNEQNVRSDKSFEPTPDWAKSANIEMKNTKKKRGFINRVGRLIKTTIPVPAVNPIGMQFINVMEEDEHMDKDVIDANMINKTDELVKTMLYDDEGDANTAINIKEHVDNTRAELAKEYNPSGHRTQSINNEVLMEEAYSEVIASALEKNITSLTKEKGLNKRNLLIGDPRIIKKMKKGFIKQGYTGRMVDRAFDKVLFEDKREILADDFDNQTIQEFGPEFTKNKENISRYLDDGANERALNLMDRTEYKRVQMNMRLNDLIKRGGSAADREILEMEIEALDKALGEDAAKRAAEMGVAYQPALFMPGAMATPGQTKVGSDLWERENIYRLYDKDFKKIMRGDEPAEVVKHEQLVSSKLLEFEEIKNLPDRLHQEMIKSHKIILNLEQARNNLKTAYNERDMQKMLDAYNIKGPEATLSKKELDELGNLTAYKRQIKNLTEEIGQETARFEAVSRMYLLNENVAIADKNTRHYLGMFGATLKDINAAPLIDKPNPSREQVRAAIDPIYEDLGIPKDSKEYEMTAPDATTEIMTGMAHMSDIALKMTVANKLGFAKFEKFFDYLGKGGKLWKAVSGVSKAGLEEAKFRLIGGNPGTGAAFYVANKAMPTIKTNKAWLDVIWNGFMKGSAGMTIAMEGAHQMETAFHAGLNDKDVLREMEEAFGTLPEAKRRIAIEFITAAPFGIKGMVDRGMVRNINPKTLTELADAAEANGKLETAAELRSQAATLGDSKTYEEMNDYMYKVDVLKKEGKYDAKGEMSLSQINDAYEKHIKETGVTDPLKNKKVAVHTEKEYFNPKVAFEGAEFAGKIETLKREGITVEEISKMSTNKIDQKYGEIIEAKNPQLDVLEKKAEPSTASQDLSLTEMTESTAKKETAKTMNKLRPKKVADKMTETKIGAVGSSKVAVASILFKGKKSAAERTKAKLAQINEGLPEGSAQKPIVEAEMKALEHVGNRKSATERQSELRNVERERELTVAEKNEYELLNMVDAKSMNRNESLKALETIKEIERTGRVVAEREGQYNAIKKTLDTQRVFDAINADITKLESEEAIVGKKSVWDNFRGMVNKYTSAQESFITMMEFLGTKDPSRSAAWEGFLHTFSKDFHRSRERQTSDVTKMMNEMANQTAEIYGGTSKESRSRMKRNSSRKHAKPFTHVVADNVIGLKNGVTIDQAMRWWQLLHNKANWKLFGKRGFGVKGEKFGAKEAQELKTAIEDFIKTNSGDLKDLEVAKLQMAKYSELYQYVNDVYAREHGVDLGYTENYVPVLFERGVKMIEAGKEVDLGSYTDILKKDSEFFMKTASPQFLKSRTASGNIKMDLSLGADQVFTDYVTRAAHYRHFQEPLRRARQVFGSESVQKAVKARAGTNFANTVINEALGDIAADHTMKSKLDKFPALTKIKNNFVMANLGANLILLPKQLMSVDAYRAAIKNPTEMAAFNKYLMRTLVDGWSTMKALNESEFMFNRAATNSMNRELVEMQRMAQKLYKSGKLKPGDIRETMLFMTKLGDRAAILLGGQALFRTKLDTYLKEGMSRKGATERAYEDFVTFTKLTQQSGNIEDLGHIQRFGALGKYATVFQNTPQQYFRMETAAIRNFVEFNKQGKDTSLSPEKRANAKEQARRSVRDFMVYHFLLPMTFRAASQGFYLGGDDKGSERFIDDEGQLVTAMLGSLSYGFLIGDLVTNVISQATTGRAFEPSVGGVAQDVVSDMFGAIEVIQEAAKEDDFKKEWRRVLDGTSKLNWEDVMSVLGAAGEISGLPLRSPALTIKGAADVISGRVDDPRAWFGYSSSVLGKYDRSPHMPLISQFLQRQEESGMSDEQTKMALAKHLVATTDPDYYKKYGKRILREYDMYKHFGRWNEDVNYLYSQARTVEDRARYLIALRDGKGARGPLTIADMIQSIGEPMSSAAFKSYINEMLQFGVITREVLVEIENQDKGHEKKIVKEFRKAAE